MNEPAESATGLTHAGLARRYRWPIAGTVLLLVAENGLTLVEPYILGVAIDRLIARDMNGVFFFLAVGLAMLVIAIVRRVYDTRVYARIYRETADETVAREVERGAPVSQQSARVSFVKEFTDFFEMMLPVALTSAVTLIGSVVMLGVISPRLGLGTLVMALLVGAVFWLSSGRIHGLNARLNDEMEKQVAVLGVGDAPARRQHLGALASWRIALSDLEARNFGAVQLLAILLVAGALVQLIWYDHASEGQVFAALTYVLQFTQAVILLPYTYQEYLRTREISGRLNADG